ncbi:MAG: DUF1659 domain-containing protein [Defluviitaleaceae bacterium]|nr:DUF1659 domain-containing protein [Defluviitaleaceae bacterium]
MELSRGLVLRYDPSGQFTFRQFDPAATDEQLHALAHQLNAFQADPVDTILRVRVFAC